MTLAIELLCNKVARIEGDREVMLPEDLTVSFSSPYNLSELVVNIRNGKKSEQVKVKNKTLDLSPFLFAGTIEMEAHLIAQGRPVKKWVIAPIIVNEIEKGFEVFDVIVDLQNRVKDLERKTKVIM